MRNWLGQLRSPAARSSGSGGRPVEAFQWTAVVVIAVVFVLVATLIVALGSFLPGNDLAGLGVGDIAPQDIRAPFDWRYTSDVLTERQRQMVISDTAPVFDPPDPEVARSQVLLTRQILDFINNVREDPFGTLAQKADDVNEITALTLEPDIVEYMLSINDESWRALDGEIVNVLERAMRQEIRESNLNAVRSQLPMQVSVRFSDSDVAAIVALVEDLLRPNTFQNPEATAAAQAAAAAAVPAEIREFERGQIIIREGARITEVDLEALMQLGLLRQRDDRRLETIGSALLASLLVLVSTGIYIWRFKLTLLRDVQFLMLLTALFLIFLAGARVFNAGDQIYIYPTAALALLLVALAGVEVAIISVIGLAFLVALMIGLSLEVGALVLFGGILGALTLRRSERLNSFFIAGLAVGLANVLIIGVFQLEAAVPVGGQNPGILLLYGLVNGVFAAAVALAAMYVVTLLFNLPTTLKLVDLAQPNQPLLQQLLREAPGTYQHSLQVANLCEQAANAIGANAELVRVASLYHDIGKMQNPAFFVENQADGVNPHDVLNDPYRSADIIISHVTDGDRIARQYRLPARIRDFIMEHHGTTRVAYFYRQAINQADDEESVDVDQFTYPGPRPQSRETAVMMLADSCESTVRARKPANKGAISDIVQQIIDARMREGQLDDSGLTSNDIRTIRNIFVDMLQAVFHPRIDYPPIGGKKRASTETAATKGEATPAAPATPPAEAEAEPTGADTPTQPHRPAAAEEEVPAVLLEDDDDEPLAEIPPLRRTGQNRAAANGTQPETDEETRKQDQSD